jgi:hypothetical protein
MTSRKKEYAYARDIYCVRLIEPTGKAFDRNAIAIADRADSPFFCLLYIMLCVIYINFFIDECDR